MALTSWSNSHSDNGEQGEVVGHTRADGAVIDPNIQQWDEDEREGKHEITKPYPGVNRKKPNQAYIYSWEQEGGEEICHRNSFRDGGKLGMIEKEEIVDGRDVTTPGEEEACPCH